jgi:hypothetical protein
MHSLAQGGIARSAYTRRSMGPEDENWLVQCIGTNTSPESVAGASVRTFVALGKICRLHRNDYFKGKLAEECLECCFCVTRSSLRRSIQANGSRWTLTERGLAL